MAARLAAPDTLQVADRFHLVRNVSEALKALLHSRRWHPPATGSQPERSPHASTTITVSPTESPPKAPQPTPRKRAAWEAIQQRRGREESLRQISQALGLDRRTMRRYVASAQPPVYPVRRPRATPLTPYREYLGERWGQGCHHAQRLHQALVQRGYKGSASMVRKILQPWRSCPEVGPSTLTFFHNHRRWMQDDRYLAAGLPVGTGIVESACGSVVKRRMEGKGKRWRLQGAEAIMTLRSLKKSHDKVLRDY
jgi:hypothetical protein